MALTKGTNSFVSLVEAKSYFEDRLDVAAWTAADDTSKSQALVTATNILNQLDWVGIAVSETQNLAFPRTGSYYDPKVGYDILLPSDIPPRISSATFELAYHLLNNDGLLDDTGTVSSVSISSISLEIQSTANLIPKSVRRIIKPLLVNGGTNPWWRSN